MDKDCPRLILLFSGKRKSGKDYICEKLKSQLGDDGCAIIRISGPLKQLYAENHNLDWAELMSDGPYKEKYRCEMIKWSDEIREKDGGYFCRAACEMAEKRPVWIVSDVRRKTDVHWFRKTYGDKIKTIRVHVDQAVREGRGWIFTSGVDDVASECNLDDFTSWNLQITNNSDADLKSGFEKLLSLSAAAALSAQ